MSRAYALKFLVSSPAPIGTPSPGDLLTRVKIMAFLKSSTTHLRIRKFPSNLQRERGEDRFEHFTRYAFPIFREVLHVCGDQRLVYALDLKQRVRVRIDTDGFGKSANHPVKQDFFHQFPMKRIRHRVAGSIVPNGGGVAP